MRLKGILFFSIVILVGGLMFAQPANAQVSIDPYGLAVFAEEEDTIATEIVITNLGEEAITYKLSFEQVDNDEEEQGGPRRDQPEGRGLLIFQRNGWGHDFEPHWSDMEGFDYDRLQTWDQFDDVDPADYDFMWIGNYESEAWVADYNDRLEIIEDYVAQGGAIYHSSGTNNHNTRPINPGGLVYTNTQSQNTCPLLVDPEDNWLINYMNENDPFDWEWRAGQNLMGNGCAHGYFTQDDIDELENADNVQLIANGNPTREPIILEYNFGRGFCLIATTVDGFLHNSPQNYQWGRTAEGIAYYLDERSQPGWMLADPVEGEIGGGEDQAVELMFIPPEGFEPGVYEMIVGVIVGDADMPETQISAIMTYEAEVGNINGNIGRADNDDPIEGAMVSTVGHYYARWSDEDGNFTIENAPVGVEFDVQVVADDFLLYEATVLLDEAGDVDWDIRLLQATCIIDEEEIDFAVEPDFVQDGIEFNVSNDGDGPLTWNAERRLVGEFDVDPWEQREQIELSGELEDTYLAGVVFIDGLYYVSGGNGRDSVNFIYILNEDGEEVDRFEQFKHSIYGMRDLDWDGELIWGGDGGDVFGFTPEGELVTQFEAGINPARAMAWDSDNEILWMSAERTDIIGYDREGNEVGRIEKENNITVYGLSYYPEDPDGFNLYIFSRDQEDEEEASYTRVYKIHPESGEVRFIIDFQTEDSRAGGLHITNQFDIYSWVFVSLLENSGRTPDALAIWQVDVRLGWMAVEPTEGVIEPGDSQQFELTLDATGLPVADFEGEIVFMHDGVGGVTRLPIIMRVTDGPVQTFRNMNLKFGWNLVSLNIVPDDSLIVNMMAPLVDAGDLMIVKNGAGNFYIPSEDFNNIPGWYVEEGYMIRVHRDTRVRVEGMSVEADTPIELMDGWNLSSYYPRRSVEATVALSSLVETGHLQIVKDGAGHFYVPEYAFSNIGVMREGRGYQYRVDADVELSYLQALPEGVRQHNQNLHRQIAATTKGTLEVPNTGQNMSLLVTSDIPVDGEIGVYAGDRLVGSGVLQDGYCGIAIWGDDPTTTEIDGAVNDQQLTIRVVNGNHSATQAYSSLTGSATYQTDSFWAIELEESESAMPESFGLESIYPNPFNSQAQIRYSLLSSGEINLALYDLSGRLVDRLASGVREAGFHTASVNGINLPSGVYIVQLKAEGQLAQQKVTLIK